MRENRGAIVFRCDAGAGIGTGHVMRCLALAAEWQAWGGRAVFVTHCESLGLLERIKSHDFDLVEVKQPWPDPSDRDITLTTIREIRGKARGPWVVLDGYHFDTSYQRILGDAATGLLVIDDTAHLEWYHANIILNQNISATDFAYPCHDDTKLLLGTRYGLLRHEFCSRRPFRKSIAAVGRRVLVTLGGADKDNVTSMAVRAIGLAHMPDLCVRVVLGSSFPHVQDVESHARRFSDRVEILEDVTDMSELMAWADVAVSAGGSTCWELAFMGLPALIIEIAENQRPGSGKLHAQGAVRNLGPHEHVSESRLAEALDRLLGSADARRKMSEKGQTLVDGLGAPRVLSAMRGLQLTLRSAHTGDGQMLWEWANDPDARRFSFSPTPIAWSEHEGWFRAKLQDPNSHIFIGLNEDALPLGQIRFDQRQAYAEASISIDPTKRGMGYGTRLIQAGVRAFRCVVGDRPIWALVKVENHASIRAFEKAGFRRETELLVKGCQALQLAI